MKIDKEALVEISDTINNLLNAVVGNSELMLEGKTYDEPKLKVVIEKSFEIAEFIKKLNRHVVD